MGKLYYNPNTIAFHNGAFTKAASLKTDLFAQSLHYGNAVFDALRSYDSALGPHIFKAKEHYTRLLEAAEKLGMKVPYTVDELVGLTYDLLDQNNLTDAYIRPLLYHDANMQLFMTGSANLFIAAWKWDKYLDKDQIDVMLSAYTRPSPRSSFVECKISGMYVNSIVAATEARQKGFDDAILLDVNGHLAEGSGANLFLEKDGKLYTPPLGNIIPGVTRATVMEICREMGVEVIEENLTPDALKDLDGAFFTGTAYQITGIRSIDRHPMQLAWEDSIGFALHEKYGQRVSQNEYDNYAII